MKLIDTKTFGAFKITRIKLKLPFKIVPSNFQAKVTIACVFCLRGQKVLNYDEDTREKVFRFTNNIKCG